MSYRIVTYTKWKLFSIAISFIIGKILRNCDRTLQAQKFVARTSHLLPKWVSHAYLNLWRCCRTSQVMILYYPFILKEKLNNQNHVARNSPHFLLWPTGSGVICCVVTTELVDYCVKAYSGHTLITCMHCIPCSSENEAIFSP